MSDAANTPNPPPAAALEMPQGNTIDALRQHLFATIAAVRKGEIGLDAARTVSELSQVVINSAKVEVAYLSVRKSGDSQFLGGALPAPEGQPAPAAAPAPAERTPLPNGIVGIRRHILKDE